MSTSRTRSGCGGCLGTIAFVIVVWALAFGFTANGKHYEMSCDCSKGVKVDSK